MTAIELGSTKDRWFPSASLGKWKRPVDWLLLVTAVATLLTNAYYLRLLEPAVSRKALALVLLVFIGLFFYISRVGLPRTRADWLDVARRLVTPTLLIVILAGGFGLRVWGISSGLPQSYVADEYDYVHKSIKMLKRGEFNPRWWYYPSFKSYMTLGTYAAVYLAGTRAGRWQTVNEITEEDMLYWGRFVAVVFGTGTIFLTFLLGRRLFGNRAGLMAAALLAVFPSAVVQSQINKPDPILAFMTTLSVLVSYLYFRKGGTKLALASGLVIGVAMGTKYNGVLVVIPFLLAVALRHGRRIFSEPDLYLGAGGSILAFLAVNPFLLADFARFLNHISEPLYTYGFTGKEGGSGVDNWYQHARYAVLFGTGLWAFSAAFVGLGVALYRLDASLVVALSFPVVYASVVSAQLVHWPGLFTPVYPFLAILAAFAIKEAAVFVGKSRRAAWVEPYVLGALMILLMLFPTRMSIRYDKEATLPDTGNIARAWINETFEPGTHFVAERHTPMPDRKRFRVSQESRMIHKSVAHYREEGVQFLIVSSQIYGRYGPEHRFTRAYEKLFEICPLVAEFEPVEGKLQGPTIRVLRVPAE